MTEGRDEPVSVEFELTPEEWVEVSLQHSAKQPQTRKAVRRVRVSFALITVLLALMGLLNGTAASAFVVLMAGIVAMALLGPMVRSARRKQLHDYALTGIANGMFGPHRVELRPEGMLDSTDGYDWLTRWSAIERVEEGEASFLVYTGPNALLPIPHSAFRDSESLRRFSHAFFSYREADEASRLARPGQEEAPGVPSEARLEPPTSAEER